MPTGSIPNVPFPTQRLYNPAADQGRAPTVTDDSTGGYVVGSIWLRTDAGNENAWHCTDATIGAAVWLETGSVKIITIYAVAFATAVSTGDGKMYFRIPATIHGYRLASVGASVGTQSTSGVVTVQLARLRAATAGGARAVVDMLSTRITVDPNEWDSKDSAIPPVIDTANDDVQEGDLIRVDVDTAGTGTQGLFVTATFSPL